MGFKDDNYATPTHRGHNPYLQEALNKLSDMKKETPEEAKKYAELSYYGDEVDAFVRGVKWQAERSYSEEEVLKLVDGAFHMYASSHRHDAKEWLVEQFKKK